MLVALPEVQAYVEIGWKLVLTAVTVALSPKLFGALRAWHEVKTAQLQAERDLERQRREAVESDFRRVSDLLSMYPRLQEMWQKQPGDAHSLLDGQLQQIERRLAVTVTSSTAARPSLSAQDAKLMIRLLHEAIRMEIVHHNMLMGQRVATDIFSQLVSNDPGWTFPSEGTPEHDSVIAAGFLAIGPATLGSPSEVLAAAAERIAESSPFGREALSLVGQELRRVAPDLIGTVQYAKSKGSPTPVADRYLLNGEVNVSSSPSSPDTAK